MKSPYLILLGFLFLGCQSPKEPVAYIISVAIDKTEELNTKVSSTSVIDELKTIPLSDAIELRLIPISDTRYTSQQSFILGKGAIGWMANDDQRRNERRVLFKRFKDSLSVLNSLEQHLNRSDIFRVLSQELNYLASKKGFRKLIINSNLKEHSSLFSVYDPKQLLLLYKNPKAVQSIFESSSRLAKDLSGIIVVIAYRPSQQEDKLFTELVLLYKMILEPRGVTIHIGYHNTITI